jgi:hypothetical protein
MVYNFVVVRIPNLEISRCVLCSHPQPFSQHREKGVLFKSQKKVSPCFSASIMLQFLGFSSAV